MASFFVGMNTSIGGRELSSSTPPKRAVLTKAAWDGFGLWDAIGPGRGNKTHYGDALLA
jgi:hypothetical protein